MSKASTLLSDLPDDILLRIFSFFVTIQDSNAHSSQNDVILEADRKQLRSSSTSALPPSSTTPATAGSQSTKKRNAKKGNRVAGLGARTLCRLCCCSRRFNHLASADQLWQPLTLTRFADRHWPTTDQKYLELIKVRREHQRKLQQPSADVDSRATEHDRLSRQAGRAVDQEQEKIDAQEGHDDDEGQHKKQRRTKFYSRFEQRAHRRRFANLDPELKYTPLAWTNTFWNWKRTFFGDCRFVESKDVQTPNRIDHAVHRNNADAARQECVRCWRPTRSCICSALTSQLYCNCRVRIMILQHPRCQVSIGTIRILKMSFKYCQIVIGKDFKEGRSLELDQALEDPNCTPLLLYPSHSAVDIQTLASSARMEQQQQRSRYHCQDCIHADSDPSTQASDPPSSPASTYPYKLIIALDGSWSHAKIMYRCNPRLQQLTQIKFPSPPQSIYHELKPEPKTTYTSTAEAVGQAVALLGWPSLGAESGSMSGAELLLDDLIRPLKKMIEIQDTIAQQQQPTQDQDGDTTV